MAGDGPPVISGKQLEELLYKDVMARVDEVLAQQELTLWRRGQEEIAQLHQDRQEAMTSLQQLRERHETLLQEQSEMRRALTDISSKLDSVANDMMEACQAVAALPSWTETASAPADAGEGQLCEGQEAFTCQSTEEMWAQGSVQTLLPPLPSFSAAGPIHPDPTAIAVAAQAAAAAAAAAAVFGLPLESAGISAPVAAFDQSELPSDGPRTPPRAKKEGAVLSLASALDDHEQTPPPPGQPLGPPSRLNIAACLDAEVSCKAFVPQLQLRAEAPAFVPGNASAKAC